MTALTSGALVSVREAAVQAFITAVTTGSTAYHTATGATVTVRRQWELDVPTDTCPFVNVAEGAEAEEILWVGLRTFVLTMSVEGILVAPALADAVGMPRAVQDAGALREYIISAVLSDVTLGGAALDVRLAAESAPPLLMIDGERPTAGFVRDFEVWFATTETSRFTPA